MFGLTGLVAVYIPDIPSKVRVQIQRENQLDREAFFELELQQVNYGTYSFHENLNFIQLGER